MQGIPERILPRMPTRTTPDRGSPTTDAGRCYCETKMQSTAPDSPSVAAPLRCGQRPNSRRR